MFRCASDPKPGLRPPALADGAQTTTLSLPSEAQQRAQELAEQAESEVNDDNPLGSQTTPAEAVVETAQAPEPVPEPALE